LNAYLDDLERGAVSPKLIVDDENLRGLSKQFSAYVKGHYTLNEEFGIYIRREAGVVQPGK
jgi:hypothetical protein